MSDGHCFRFVDFGPSHLWQPARGAEGCHNSRCQTRCNAGGRSGDSGRTTRINEIETVPSDAEGHRAIALRIGGVVPGHRTGFREAGNRPRSREHTPTEASRPSAPGPVDVASGLPAESPVSAARDGSDSGLRLLSWHKVRAWVRRPLRGVISSTAGQAHDEGLHPVPIGPDHSPHPVSGVLIRYCHRAGSPALMTLCPASCAGGCQQIGSFRHRMRCPIVAFIVV